MYPSSEIIYKSRNLDMILNSRKNIASLFDRIRPNHKKKKRLIKSFRTKNVFIYNQNLLNIISSGILYLFILYEKLFIASDDKLQPSYEVILASIVH